MKFFGYSFMFLLMYGIGIGLYIIPPEYKIYYIVGIFLLINVLSIFNEKIFSSLIMRPMQLSVAAVTMFQFLTNDTAMIGVSLLLLISLIVMEWEDFNYLSIRTKEGFVKKVRLIIVSTILPFSVTYIVMIFRPAEYLLEPFVLILYFTILFFSAKYLVNNWSVCIFFVTQVAIFYVVANQYFAWSGMELFYFYFAIMAFLVINVGRKELLSVVYR